MIEPVDLMLVTMVIVTTATTSTVTAAALLQDPIVTATIAVPSSLLFSSTYPTKIMTTKEKYSIRKVIIGNPTLVLVVAGGMTITPPPLGNMLASPRKHRLMIATINVVALANNLVIETLTIPTVIVHLTLVVRMNVLNVFAVSELCLPSKLLLLPTLRSPARLNVLLKGFLFLLTQIYAEAVLFYSIVYYFIISSILFL